MHFIHFPKRKEYGKAIMALLDMPRGEYLALPDYQMVVNDEQINALEAAKIGFEYLSKTAKNANHAERSSAV